MFPLAGAAATGGLQLLTRCGKRAGEDVFCKAYEYCSEHSLSCESCSNPCNETGNNFDEGICVSNCQDFIHDKIKRYITTDDHRKPINDLQEQIESLRDQVAISLCLSVVLIVVMGVIGGFLWLRHRRLIKKEQELMDQKITVTTIANNNVCNDLGMKPPSSASNTVAPSVITDITRLSSRRPEEDSTLEYAYDNQGMVPSPIVRDPRDETIF
uniref:1-(5-phosphoribosyl)-5-[(5-phosphoribosylamino)methylideneamino] imidazole-4-carboxamide isomerase n=2 Tax=Lygus hesperus TaxID=30085 RepID=A0A0A9X5S2_LYGHE